MWGYMTAVLDSISVGRFDQKFAAQRLSRKGKRPTEKPFFFPCLLLQSLFSLSFRLFVVFSLYGGGGRGRAIFRLARA
jgi:hypothetical protein